MSEMLVAPGLGLLHFGGFTVRASKVGHVAIPGCCLRLRVSSESNQKRGCGLSEPFQDIPVSVPSKESWAQLGILVTYHVAYTHGMKDPCIRVT